ncbi:DNA topoisomerase I [Gloeomargarita lithophora Alchichica-D10]|uniref:DNA topoisomerase 1 n=1 Tax=Gloeomargarita lithophora Alchichica-D10 TaxID=1188229 RepID=A0A1J0AEK9_9CYAN|nr:type I DNA topoisomerase [Gloeomargarita lithophora]APB34378.1 DNA topoisomerase I [Gloeomargarita lithophora Alchichica-D10]
MPRSRATSAPPLNGQPTLVIVESPTKARTIRQYLPDNYRVEASMGHVRDLPQSASDIPAELKGQDWATLGVNVQQSFEPLYIVPGEKKKVVSNLKAALKEVKELILATDEDREGESISWHLAQILQPRVPVKRMVFHEITQEAIHAALQQCRQVDEGLVRAQETRRILDRLVGYTLSPLLWQKVGPGLSAGRVQSVAVRLLVQRERQRRAFRTAEYWDLKAQLTAHQTPFESRLVALGGVKLATGQDFDPQTGELLPRRRVRVLDQTQAETLCQQLQGSTWRVQDLESRQVQRKPAPPFTTSTLQQEANRKLRLSTRDTMRIAQNLYEQGYITYMRTDSVHLSQQAITAARSCVQQMYGASYLSPKPRQYATQSKGAQEAHEAIRPAGSDFRTPQVTGLTGRELALYDLIWKRTVATQMAEARLTHLTVTIQAGEAEFRTSGKRIDFPGFFRAYVEGSDDPQAALDDQEISLPPLAVGDTPQCTRLEALRHETQPPDRYTEASLVKTLESEGVGRPSTYASIIGTIQDRGYAQTEGNALVPTFTAFAVTTLLEQNFPHLVDTGFTAQMEQTLDDIAGGEVPWLPYLQEFYLGEQGLASRVKTQAATISPTTARTLELEGLGEAKVHISTRYGPYVEIPQNGEVVTVSLPKDLTPAQLTPQVIEELLRQKTAGPTKLGMHPETGEPIFALTGTYGPYVQLGEATEINKKPKRASLPKGVTPEQVTLEMAVGLLALPRALGAHPAGGKVKAGLGRFGPYVVHDRGKESQDFRSLKPEDDVLSVTLERALELLAQPKASRGRSSSTPLRELGAHPQDKEPVNVYQGPYGYYVKHGKVNAGLPDGTTPETVTLAQAVELLAQRSQNPRKKATTRRKKS